MSQGVDEFVCLWLCYSSSGRRRRRSVEVLLQDLRNPTTQDDQATTADADAMLEDSSESDDVRDFAQPHQSLPVWLQRAQVSTNKQTN
jgi:hypothetical protein